MELRSWLKRNPLRNKENIEAFLQLLKAQQAAKLLRQEDMNEVFKLVQEVRDEDAQTQNTR
jgi:hypothetical protein